MANGILNSLRTSSQALNAFSRGVQVAGNNIANLNTEGYARQRVSFGTEANYDSGDGIRSTGVRVNDVQSVRNTVLDQQVIAENKLTGSLNAQLETLNLMENTLGSSLGRSAQVTTLDGADGSNLGGSGLAQSVEDFLGSWHELSATPELATTRSVVYQNAVILTEQFHALDERMSAIDTELTDRINQDADAIEGIVDKIAELNNDIARLEVGQPGAAAELRDNRQRLLEELAQYTDFTVTTNTNNSAMLDLSLTAELDGSQVQLLTGIQRLTDLTFDGTDLRAGQPAEAISLTSGSLHGFVSVQRGTLATFRSDLDAFAEQIVTAVNRAYNPTNAAGEDFFDAAGTTAGTIQLRQATTGATPTPALTADNLRAAEVGATAGGNTIALAVASLSQTTFSIGSGDFINGSLTEFPIGLASDIGQAIDSTSLRSESQANVSRFLEEQRDALSGVNLDEEVTDMLRFQRSYQATSRVINVLDEMLEVLVTQLV